MSTIDTPSQVVSSVVTSTSAQISTRPFTISRFVDFLELSKPKIALLSLVTVTIGFLLGCEYHWEPILLMHALIGIALVATSSSTFNQLIEIETDLKMKRTVNRPIPVGRISPKEAFLFGTFTIVAGIIYISYFVNVTTAILSAVTFLIYVAIYTPIKRMTSLATAIGAIAGALPPVLGWTAAGGELDAGAWTLFGILFLWQFPHFLAISWLYRHEYKSAGLLMLPRLSYQRVGFTGWLAIGYAFVLIPVSLVPANIGMAGSKYSLAALILGLGYLFCTVLFAKNETPQTARRLIRCSLLYLPAILFILLWDHWRLFSL